MVRTVEHGSFHTQHREPGQHAALGSLLDPLSHSRNILLGNGSAHNRRFKFKGLLCIGIHGLKVYLTVTILTTAAGLLGILAVHIHCLGKGLLVSNLGSTHICLHVKLTKQTVYNNLQMQLSHTGNNGLSGLLVSPCTEGGILLGKLCQRLTHLSLTSLGLRLNGNINNRLRELHGFQNNRMLIITDRITGSSQLKAYCCSDITGIYFIQLLPLIGMHLQDTSYPLLFVLCRIQHIRTGIKRSGIYPEKCQLSYKGIRHNLKCQC